VSKILLFDFDGTIADSFENFITVTKELSLTYKFPTLSRDELEKLRSDDARSIISQLKIPFYKQMRITDIKPFPDLPEVLQSLKNKGYMLGILTSNGQKNVTSFLQHNSIDIFDYIYCDSSIFGKDKIIRSFLKQHNLSKEEVIYIGDEIRDIQACHKVGIRIVSVTWGFNSQDGLIKHNPDYIINKPPDLLPLLSALY
jgi:phosphoglycolate phosphatase